MGVAAPTALPPLATQLPAAETAGVEMSFTGSGLVKEVQPLGASSVEDCVEHPRLEYTPTAGEPMVHWPPVGAAQLHGPHPRASLTPV